MREKLKHYLPVLGRSDIFRGLEGPRLEAMLDVMDARLMEYERGETIFRCGDQVREAGIVLDGMVIAEDADVEGDSTQLTLLRPGSEYGAYMVISGKTKSPMRLYAAERTRVMTFDVMRAALSELRGEDQWLFLNNMLIAFANKCVDLYQKARIYGKKRIRSRIRIYLMSLQEKDGWVILPMNRTALAEWLGVDRAALTRELGRMQSDGLIEVNKRRVLLKDREYFRQSGAALPGEGDGGREWL